MNPLNSGSVEPPGMLTLMETARRGKILPRRDPRYGRSQTAAR